MPRKFLNLNGKVLKGKRYFRFDKTFITKLRGSTLGLNDKRFLRSDPYIRCSNERALKCINSKLNIDKKQKMAVELDHMYMQCGDSKSSPNLMKELREFNVLHLDVIRQLNEQLASKDKIIKSLQEENKTLKARLGRIERRLSLNVQKKTSEVAPISVQTDFSSSIPCEFSIKSELSPKSTDSKSGSRSQLLLSPTTLSSPKSPTYSDSNDSTSHSRILKKDTPRKHHKSSHTQATPPASPPLRISPREKRSRKDVSQDEKTLQNNNSLISPLLETKTEPDDTLILSNEAPGLGHKRNLGTEPLVTPKKTRRPSSNEVEKSAESKEEGLTDHNLRSRDKTKEYISRDFKHTESLLLPMPFPIEPTPPTPVNKTLEKDTTPRPPSIEPRRFKDKTKETRRVRSEGILTTQDSYFLNSPKHTNEKNYLDENNGVETQVEIPRWRIKVLNSLYVIEGTENLEDEIFVKRHAKLEQDERRRKRWDLQRLREQRQYERLLERYEIRNNQQDSSSSCQSLWPNPDSNLYLQVEEELPVCAFGQPLAQITQSDFTLPWISETAAAIITRRRRR